MYCQSRVPIDYGYLRMVVPFIISKWFLFVCFLWKAVFTLEHIECGDSSLRAVIAGTAYLGFSVRCELGDTAHRS